MISEIDPMQDFDKLRAPTDAEIEELTQRTSPASRARLEDAARSLLVAKMMAKDTTPWRELVAAYRASEPVRAKVEVVDHEGVPRVQVTFTERGFGIEGVAGRVHACTGDLVRALDLIDTERERNRVNGALGGPREKKSLDEDIAAFLRRRNYENAPSKKKLRLDAEEHFGVGKTTVTNAITEHGLAKRR